MTGLGGLRVGVVGGGTMGQGIAQAYVSRGAAVTVVDLDLRRAEAAVERVLDRLARGAAVAGEAAPAAALTAAADVDALRDAAAVVEAVVEDAATKVAVLTAVDAVVSAGALLATVTSALPVGELAVALRHPERLCGMHFFNPVPASLVVEVVPHAGTSPATLDRAAAHVSQLGKEPVLVRDSPGFASTRLGVALGLEAMRTVEDGVASAEDVDRLMTLGYRHATGPLRTSDLVGLDVRLAIAEHLAASLGPRFAPPRILREKVAAGDLGRKTGRGFFAWASPSVSAGPT
ncbi:MAG TPA: 3-hydroxyacyl-CoA dehydrogenase family protein [Candidatus Dormibacteraeota bacterium]|nr:3-hydroxyacyl-CoA dehydrogenase family protein [Candidatus Dormibacteraeota bacterium]